MIGTQATNYPYVEIPACLSTLLISCGMKFEKIMHQRVVGSI